MLFFDAKASLRRPAVLLVEPVAIFLSIVLYIWWLRFEHPSFAFVILAIVVLSHIWHGEAPHDLGFRRENFAACLAIFWPALLFTVGKLLIGLYLGRTGIASAFGAAGSLVVLLVWVYYSAQILFFGAEFTKTHAQQRRLEESVQL